jgi:hypothetical protein
MHQKSSESRSMHRFAYISFKGLHRWSIEVSARSHRAQQEQTFQMKLQVALEVQSKESPRHCGA